MGLLDILGIIIGFLIGLIIGYIAIKVIYLK